MLAFLVFDIYHSFFLLFLFLAIFWTLRRLGECSIFHFLFSYTVWKENEASHYFKYLHCQLIREKQNKLIRGCFFFAQGERKEQTNNYNLILRIPIASANRVADNWAGHAVQIVRPSSELAPNLASKSAQAFPSRKVCLKMSCKDGSWKLLYTRSAGHMDEGAALLFQSNQVPSSNLTRRWPLGTLFPKQAWVLVLIRGCFIVFDQGFYWLHVLG